MDPSFPASPAGRSSQPRSNVRRSPHCHRLSTIGTGGRGGKGSREAARGQCLFLCSVSVSLKPGCGASQRLPREGTATFAKEKVMDRALLYWGDFNLGKRKTFPGERPSSLEVIS